MIKWLKTWKQRRRERRVMLDLERARELYDEWTKKGLPEETEVLLLAQMLQTERLR